ncbi:hypothetical protein K466DRAFT_605533 [Polyporus arcularius HHB13444]|uniref:DUF6534 domain-containing protein n=1 Tax=Polyporus arcularius HHB13444 TaxID=1314778 RepID=A0A5C3NS18_9APHY|nr:hypothetical protein K466DRAFT_605533 [Polyporus arcularius HHB13444]
MGTPAVEIYGPIFIGVVFNIALYGIMVTQTYLYFQVYKRDRTWMKLLVFLLFICDTVNCCFDVAFLYIPLVNNFGNNDAISRASWSAAFGDPFMTAFIAALVQFFFAWRVKVLTSNIFAVCVICFCSFAQLCGGLGTSIAVGRIPEFVHFQKFQVIVVIWLAFSAVADTLITTALVWHLRRNKTGMALTDTVINKIIRLTVQTGLITALCAIIDLVLFLVSPTGLHLIFNLPLSKLYTNSLMSSLNSRTGWQYSESSQAMSQNVERSEPQQRGVPRGVRNVNMLKSDVGRRQGPQEIYIDVESHEMVDVVDMKGSSYSGGDGYVPDQKAAPMAHSRGSDSPPLHAV